MPMNRRRFLKGGLAIGALGAALPSTLVRTLYAAPEDFSASDALTSARAILPVPPKHRTLVVVQLGGGNDGLNTLPPYEDGLYHDLRPGLSLGLEDGVIPLHDGVGLNPNLEPLMPYWRSGNMAVVQGVGYPEPNRSHFRSMEIWHTAVPETIAQDGWLGRYLDINSADTGNRWRAISVGSTQAEAFEGDSFVPSMESADGYRLQMNAHGLEAQHRLAAWQTLHERAGAGTGSLPLLSRTGLEAFESAEQLQGIAAQYTPSAEYPQGNPLAASLQTVAQVIDAGLGTSLAYVTASGFDTHARQDDDHPALLASVGSAIGAFMDDIAHHGHGDDVVVLVFSEFGRRVGVNGSDGTDHGTAGPVFLLGNPIAGGLYGEPPDLSGLQSGDLRYSTDFRSVYATVLEDWLETESPSILGEAFGTLPVLKPAPSIGASPVGVFAGED